MNQATAFSPSNDLERALVAAQQGQLPVPSFMDTLLASKVFVLVDKDIGPAGVWDDSVSPMILANSEGSPVLAIFTASERSGDWPTQQPRFGFGLLADFSWLLSGIAPSVGVVINPGLAVGLEMPASGVQQLKQRMQVE